jgi:hypothetical protein
MGGKFAEVGATVDGDWKETVLGSLCYRKFADPVIETISQRQKLGGSVALAYMSMISNTDVYNNMIE